jgi:tRNA-dihydrouridine synthase
MLIRSIKNALPANRERIKKPKEVRRKTFVIGNNESENKSAARDLINVKLI